MLNSFIQIQCDTLHIHPQILQHMMHDRNAKVSSGSKGTKRPASPWQTWRDHWQRKSNCGNAHSFFFMLRPKATRGILVLPVQKKNDEQRGSVPLARCKKEMDIRLSKERSAFGLSKICIAWGFTICVSLTRNLLCIYPLAGSCCSWSHYSAPMWTINIISPLFSLSISWCHSTITSILRNVTAYHKSTRSFILPSHHVVFEEDWVSNKEKGNKTGSTASFLRCC